MTIQVFFPMSTEGVTWEDWNGSLLHYFGEEPIPYLPEMQWKEVGNSLAQLAHFMPYAIPDPDNFNTWQEWGDQFTQALNGKVEE